MNCRFFKFSSSLLVLALTMLAGLLCVSDFCAKAGAQEPKSTGSSQASDDAGDEKDKTDQDDSSGNDSADEQDDKDLGDDKDSGDGDDASSDIEESIKEVLEGHSFHGEAFNEGPRQAAYLMGGTGNVNFKVSTESKEAQAFINQGVGQLHGFWYLEAERSFRQAAAIDPDCAMAYWGAAMAAYSERKRSQGFIKKAVELKEGTTDREKMYIDSLEKYFSDKEKSKKKRAQQYLKDLESIVIKYPDDIEAKAFVAHRIWHNAREGTPISSYLSTDALIKQIYEVEPLHPAHHYTIHLWDHRHPENAVRSAARCGPAAPAIAHMWHMPGHIYSRLKRYEDAVYQQEASARVDHAHMMRDRVMPDEISNFAHNNEWLIRNLIFIGRVNDAVSLAMNMTELPQHPKYNTLDKRGGSASYGRRRLLQVLREYQLFEKSVELCRSPYLQVPKKPLEQIKTLRLLGCSAAMLGRGPVVDHAREQLDQMLNDNLEQQSKLKKKIANLTAALDDSADRPPRPETDKVDPKKGKLHLKQAKAELAKVEKEIKKLKKPVEKALLAIDGYQSVADGDFETAHTKLTKATGEDVSWLGELEFLAGDSEKGIKKVQDQIKRRPKEVIPMARLAYLQYQNGDVDLAKETFQKLRDTSSSMDLEYDLFARLKPIADELELGSQWQKPLEPAVDLGFRPPLDTIGPFRWSPSPAPEWTLLDSENKTASSDDYKGRPYVLIFYLGHGCLHCAEQLQAFGPRVGDFESAGMKMMAISTDGHEGLQESIKNFTGDMPFRLASDESNDVFKQFRAYDDFEKLPLHGTFLIDGNGEIRWQDIGYEPFMDHQFLLDEAKRLLKEELETVKRTEALRQQVSSN